MKCLVVISHPVKDSLCQYFATQTIEHLRVKGYQITVLDLYQNEFSPALTASERLSYYDASFDDKLLGQELAQLKSAESLVLVFPTWWFGFPAMLKGWFDRVWAPGHAYDHAKDLGAITPRLDNLKEVKVITTLGSPWWVDKLIMFQPVKRVLKIGLLGACTKNCQFTMLSFHQSEQATQARVESFLKKMRARF